jgi:hypothetical protein
VVPRQKRAVTTPKERLPHQKSGPYYRKRAYRYRTVTHQKEYEG